MYQVLQVYTCFSFFDNFLSRSIKVGQLSSRRRRRDVVATFPQSFGLEQNSETSLIRRGDVFLLENIVSRRDVSETNWSFEKVSKGSQKKSNMFDFTATPSRPAKPPGDVAATSPRPTETPVANRSPTSLHASEIGALASS